MHSRRLQSRNVQRLITTISNRLEGLARVRRARTGSEIIYLDIGKRAANCKLRGAILRR